MPTGESDAAGWARKKQQIIDAILRLDLAMAELQAAQTALNDVVSTDPGGGPNIRDRARPG